jgi:hypothetical protein
MWVKQCHKPPMTGNGKHNTYKNGDDWGWFIIVFSILLKFLVKEVQVLLLTDFNFMNNNNVLLRISYFRPLGWLSKPPIQLCLGIFKLLVLCFRPCFINYITIT